MSGSLAVSKKARQAYLQFGTAVPLNIDPSGKTVLRFGGVQCRR